MRLHGRHHKFSGSESGTSGDSGANGERGAATGRRWVTEAMAELAAEGDGWINLQPSVHDDDDPESQPSAGGMFSSNSSEIPMATWTAPGRNRRGPTKATIGIQHGAGMKALPWLRDVGLARPDGWRVLADSPRRGLVLEVPDETPPDEVLDWLLGATSRLCPVDVPDRWQATVFTHAPKPA